MKKKNITKWIKIFCFIPLILLQIVSLKAAIAATLNPEVTSIWITPAYQEITGNSVTLQWSAQSGADSYDLYQSTDTAFHQKIATVTGTSQLVSSLSQNTRYHFEIVVNYSDGSKKLSNARTVYVKDGTNPNPPTGLSTPARASNQITLTWTASNSNDVHHYEIHRRIGTSGSYSMIGVTNTDTVSYTDVGFNTSSTIYYQIRAVDNSNNKSTFASFSSVSAPGTTYTSVSPGLPNFNNANLATNDNTRVNLSWTAPAGSNIAGYQIYRKSTIDSNYLLLATTSNTSYVDPSVEHNTDPIMDYSYYIVTLDTNRRVSGNSTILSVAVPKKDMEQPGPPQGLKSTSFTVNKIDLSWTAPNSTDISEYIIWRSNDGINYNTSYRTELTTYRVDSNIAVENTYYFRVMAVDNNGNYSEGSNIFWGTTPPLDNDPPNKPVVSVEDIGKSFVTLRWDAVLDNDIIERYSVDVIKGDQVIENITVGDPPQTGTLLETVTSLGGNTEYKFIVTAFDRNGNNTPSDTIIVRTEKDTDAPEIIFRKPAENSTNIAYSQPIIVRFNEPINPSTVNNSSFKVIRVDDRAEISGTLTVNGNEIKFVTNSLEPNKTYQVTLNTTITDTAGIPLEPQRVYSFTTGTEKYERPHGNYMDNTALCKYCHNAHTGERQRLLNQKQIYEVCFTCHDGTGAEGVGSKFNVAQQFAKSNHHPVFPEEQPTAVEGVLNFSCIKCHNPHDSGKNLDTGVNNPSWARLLDSFNKGDDLSNIQPTRDNKGKEFCWNCHGDTTQVGGTGQNGYSFGYLDDIDKNGNSIVLGTSETRYRTDHQTFFPKDYQTPSNPGSGPIVAKPEYGYGHNSWRMETYKKDFVPNGNLVNGTTDNDGESASGTNVTCVACHEKHGSEVKPLLRNDINGNDPNVNPIKNGKEFCYQCHQNKVEFAYSDSLNPKETSLNNYDGKDINEARGHAQFDCQVCHNPHGSPYPNYLRLNYRVDTSSWQTFKDSDAALCFDCHDKAKVLTGGATVRGRTGDLPAEYYHNYHVRNSDGKDIDATCKNCHRPHGSIAEENANSDLNHKVGFANNQVGGSRKYNRGSSGNGSCNLNCHGRDHDNFDYSRAYRGTAGVNSYALKDNWKTESWLLNNRPTIYKNGTDGSGTATHFRDQGSTPGDGYMWK